jgi:hypothetical protein
LFIRVKALAGFAQSLRKWLLTGQKFLPPGASGRKRRRVVRPVDKVQDIGIRLLLKKSEIPKLLGKLMVES